MMWGFEGADILDLMSGLVIRLHLGVTFNNFSVVVVK